MKGSPVGDSVLFCGKSDPKMNLGCTIVEELNKILHSSRGEEVGIVKEDETFNEDGEKMINC